MNQNNVWRGIGTDVGNITPHDGLEKTSPWAWNTKRLKNGQRRKWQQNFNTNPRTTSVSHIGREVQKTKQGPEYNKNKQQNRGSPEAGPTSTPIAQPN